VVNNVKISNVAKHDHCPNFWYENLELIYCHSILFWAGAN